MGDGTRPDGSEELRAVGLQVTFHGVHALTDVDLRLRRGQILGLIGPNGAGKSTMVNVLSGFQRPTRGAVFVDGQRLTGARPERYNRRGVARTFQSVRLFQALSVWENVEVAALRGGAGRRAARELTTELLARFELEGEADRVAGSLPYGAERRLSLARSLATRPRYLLLDEPAAGMNEPETDALTEILTGLPDAFGCGVLVVEHDMRLILSACDEIHVLAYGSTLLVDEPEVVRNDPAVIEAYLGAPEVAHHA